MKKIKQKIADYDMHYQSHLVIVNHRKQMDILREINNTFNEISKRLDKLERL